MEPRKRYNKHRFIIIVVLVILFILANLVTFFTDFEWFRELGYVSVFFTKLFTQLKIGVPTFIVVTVLARIYFKFIKQSFNKKMSIEGNEGGLIKAVSWGLSAIFGGIVTYIAVTQLWFQLLQMLNSTSFGIKDPMYGMDISFYVFKLGFIKSANDLAIAVLITFIILTLVYYALLIATKGESTKVADEEKIFDEADRFDGTSKPKQESKEYEGPFKGTAAEPFIKMFFSAGENFTRRGNISNVKGKRKVEIDDDNVKQLFSVASTQLIIAGALLFLMLGVFFFLQQFDLLQINRGAVYGAGYTDTHITIWVYRILMVLSVIGAIAVIFGIKLHKARYIAMVPIVMVLVAIVGAGGAMVTQNFIVSPNEIAKESTYIDRNIEFTQKAYDLDKVSTSNIDVNTKLTQADIKNNPETINNIRINDYLPAEKFYNQTQAIRKYYEFKDVDVDRYMINGEYTQAFISAREINEEEISQTWLNKHLKYTHGYGMTLSRVDQVTPSGQPDMLVKDIPPQSDVEEINITRPEIYFGEMTDTNIYVGAKEKEFDYPDGDSNQYSNYEGKAGIKLNPLNKVLFAIRERSMKLLVSSSLSTDAKIIMNRNIRDRVQEIMPYLTYDKNPYMVTADGKLYWIIDAYTTSSEYPYSQPYNSNTTVNYVRNSVKVVIDAYNGDATYYVVDQEDPIALTYMKIYPALFKNISEMPTSLQPHIKYPNDMFEIQAEVYARYHMNDPKVFYQDEDLWGIANEIYGTEEQQMEPNYYIMKLPNEKKAEFVNSIPYTPKDKKNMTGLLIARNDGEHYGQLVLYKTPKSKVVYGPRQIEAQIDQNTTISKDFSLWNSSGSKYSRGNLFVIPIEDSFLYVEPVYLESTDSSIPEVKRVIVAYGNKIAYEETLGEALNSLFGEGTIKIADGVDTSEITKDADVSTLTQVEIVQKANDAYDDAQAALKDGDWAKYGIKMDELEGYLGKLS